MARHLFTSESVTEGHPDKICDQISDAVLDAIFAQDPNGRVACETCASTGLIHIMGEITTSCYVDIPKIARQVVLDIGYDRSQYGFDGNTCAVITNIDEQSGDIALGVDKSYEAKARGESELDNGAGDQGMMFGYACDETPELMPLAISIAQKMAKRLTDVRKQGLVDYLRPDGKTQITVEYGDDGAPIRVDTVVLSTQHSPDVSLEQIRKDMIELVIKPTVPADGNTCAVITNIDEQSGDIALGVDKSYEAKARGESELDNGAGDQGMMFGYACDETPELMPLAISIAQKMAKRLTDVRKQGLVDYLRPDGKTQITVEYGDDGAPIRVDTVVLSTQHSPDVSLEQIRKDMIELVIKPTVPADLLDDETKIYVNPTGRFVNGGPAADTGLTGRKIIVDTYGGSAPHGGGAFSGKDPTKVDRSAAYAARWVAKNVVAAGLARKCQVQLAYAIGVARPVSVLVETFGTGVVADDKLEAAVEKVFDLRPTAIIRDLDLRKPIYRQLAAYGHMGREDLGVSWEKTDRVDALKAALGL